MTVPSHRILRTAKATLTRSFYIDEAETAATGSVAVTVTRLDGTVVDSATATPDGQGGYAYNFPGRDVLDSLIVSWSGTVSGDAIVEDQDRIEIVGGFFFGLAEGRAVDPALASTTKFPTSDLIERRNEVEDECERICGQAFVPRFRRASVNGLGATTLMMPDPLVRTIRAVKVGNVTYTSTQLAALGFSDAGILYHSAGWIPGVPPGLKNITVEYEHGWDVPPSDIVRAAKLRFKSLLLEGRSALPDRAERVVTQTDTGTTVYASPTPDRTGIPAVDAAYGRYLSPRPGFG